MLKITQWIHCSKCFITRSQCKIYLPMEVIRTEIKWRNIENCIKQTTTEALGKKNRYRKKWNLKLRNDQIENTIKQKHDAYIAYLQCNWEQNISIVHMLIRFRKCWKDVSKEDKCNGELEQTETGRDYTQSNCQRYARDVLVTKLAHKESIHYSWRWTFMLI